MYKILLKLSSTSVLTQLMGVVTTKIVAITLGTEGVAIYSQTRQVIQWFITAFSLNSSTAIINSISKIKNDIVRALYVFTLITFSFLVSTIMMLVFFLPLEEYLPNGVFFEDYAFLFVVITGVFSALFLAIVTGLKYINDVIKINLISSFILMIATYPGIMMFGNGFIYLTLSISFVFTTLYSIKTLKTNDIFMSVQSYFSVNFAKEHVKTSIVFLLTGLIGATSHILIRDAYIQNYGLDMAGVFESGWNIGILYIMVILGAFTTYYIPLFSS